MITKFQTKEVFGTLYQKAGELTVILEKTDNFPNKKQLDDFHIVFVLEGGGHIVLKPQDGIVKFNNIKTDILKMIIQ